MKCFINEILYKLSKYYFDVLIYINRQYYIYNLANNQNKYFDNG